MCHPADMMPGVSNSNQLAYACPLTDGETLAHQAGQAGRWLSPCWGQVSGTHTSAEPHLMQTGSLHHLVLPLFLMGGELISQVCAPVLSP